MISSHEPSTFEATQRREDRPVVRVSGDRARVCVLRTIASTCASDMFHRSRGARRSSSHGP